MRRCRRWWLDTPHHGWLDHFDINGRINNRIDFDRWIDNCGHINGRIDDGFDIDGRFHNCFDRWQHDVDHG